MFSARFGSCLANLTVLLVQWSLCAGPESSILAIVELLKQHPEGLSSGEIREKLGLKASEQSQLDRRRRDLKKWFYIDLIQQGRTFVYRYVGPRDQQVSSGNISQKQRARILHAAHAKCQMCGRTIPDDGIKLEVDHRIPQDWGGTDDDANLWAICEECNGGKKSYFASFDTSQMKSILVHDSVHKRIGELLKMHFGQAVTPDLIELVANARGKQEDWKKRTRDLRYLGWKIKVVKKMETGRVVASYRLDHFEPWPESPTRLIAQYERERAIRNRQKIE
jgi:5-methylcytosine-specific restriction endonuclease McrA